MRRIKIMKVALIITLGILQNEVCGWSFLPTSATDSPGFDGYVTGKNKDSIFSEQVNKIPAQNSDVRTTLQTTDGKENQFSNTELSRPRRSNLKIPLHDFEGSQGFTPQQREYFLKLMSMLTSKEGSFHQNKDRSGPTEGETDFVDEEDGEPIELGYYGSNPYPFTSVESDDDHPPKSKQESRNKGKNNGGDAIAIMRSSPPDDTDDAWDGPVAIHHHHADRRSHSAAKLGPGNGISRYHMGEFSPVEHRLVTHHYPGLDKRNAKYFASLFG